MEKMAKEKLFRRGKEDAGKFQLEVRFSGGRTANVSG